MESHSKAARRKFLFSSFDGRLFVRGRKVSRDFHKPLTSTIESKSRKFDQDCPPLPFNPHSLAGRLLSGAERQLIPEQLNQSADNSDEEVWDKGRSPKEATILRRAAF